MKNGDYVLVVAPADYPGKKYRGKYCYEHRLKFWLKHGILPEIVHHKNGRKLENTSRNLQGMSKSTHSKYHHVKVMPVHCVCDFCKRKFYRAPHEYRWSRKHYKTMNCSRHCSVLNQHKRGKVNLVGRNGA